MQILEQQQWFIKLVWAVFGVTADEMGYTFDSNRAISEQQSLVTKRKAIRPVIDLIERHLNTEILPEFFSEGESDFVKVVRSCPVVFSFKDYDADEDKKKHDIFEQEIRMGVKTAEMVADELGINLDELKKSKSEALEAQQNLFGSPSGMEQNKEDKWQEDSEEPNFEKEESEDESKLFLKSKPDKDLEKSVDEFIKDVYRELDEKLKEV
jgi:hypothetical protein